MSDLIHQSLDDIAKKLKSDKIKATPKAKKPVNKGKASVGATGKAAGKKQQIGKGKVAQATSQGKASKGTSTNGPGGGKQITAKRGKGKAAVTKVNPQIASKLASVPIMQRLGPKVGTVTGYRVRIKNLSTNVVNQKDIKQIFAAYGPIVSASIAFDGNNRPTGNAEIIIKEQDKAKQAVAQLHQCTVDNIPMTVSFAGPVKPESSKTPLSKTPVKAPKAGKNDLVKKAVGATFIMKNVSNQGQDVKTYYPRGNTNTTKGKVGRRNRKPRNNNAMMVEN